ncbi:hypothetical protein EPI10_000359 [Gossypium australe]|uniref:Uncharacterized protein n=1 Tax=Gossypium australe TaxID=47621 RepID=A0A5B6V7N4_9ROSI|nr:hypothetical protein EPI10_000359 [Gossypium australe]
MAAMISGYCEDVFNKLPYESSKDAKQILSWNFGGSIVISFAQVTLVGKTFAHTSVQSNCHNQLIRNGTSSNNGNTLVHNKRNFTMPTKTSNVRNVAKTILLDMQCCSCNIQ